MNDAADGSRGAITTAHPTSSCGIEALRVADTSAGACLAITERICAAWPLALAGTLVGAHRWAYVSCHPGCWAAPLVGVVLEIDDPEAWTDTLIFCGRPERAQVRDHIASVGVNHGWDAVPVRWPIGDGGHVIRWQTAAKLVEPALELQAWTLAREQAYLDEKARRQDGEERNSLSERSPVPGHAHPVAA